MFFNQLSHEYYSEYVINEWVSLWLFFEEISYEEENSFEGHGFFRSIIKDQFNDNESVFGYILNLNNRYFGFIGNPINEFKEGGSFKFKHIVEFNEKFHNCDIFAISENYVKKFDTNLEVDVKFYSYSTEEKILISKKGDGNIDLYASYQYDFEKETINGKIFPASLNALKSKMFSAAIEERFSNIKK